MATSGYLYARMAARPDELRSLALVAISGVLFALQGSLLKLTLALGIGIFEAITVRGSVQLMGCMCIILCRAREHSAAVALLGQPGHRRLLAARALIGYAGISFNFAAIERLALGDAAAISFFAPVISALLAWAFLAEAIRWRDTLAIAVACAGIILVARPPILFGAEGAPDPIGVLFALASALAVGNVVVLLRYLSQSVDWAVVLLYQAVGQVLISLPIALALGRSWLVPPPAAIA